MTIVHGPYCDAEYRRDSCVCLDEADRREARERARHEWDEDNRERIGRILAGLDEEPNPEGDPSRNGAFG